MRLLGVLQMVVNVSLPGGFAANGRAINSAQKMRLMHAAIRSLVRSAGMRAVPEGSASGVGRESIGWFLDDEIDMIYGPGEGYDVMEQRNAELALINDVQRGLAENLEMQTMYDLVGDRIRDIFDAQVVAIWIVNRDTGLLDNPYMYEKGVRYDTDPLPIESGPSRYVLDTGETLVINDRFTERANEFGEAPTWGEGGDPQSGVYVPLITGGGPIGRITLQNMDRENAFGLTRREWEIADLLAAGLNNQEIANCLSISRNTVKEALKRIFRKVDVDSRAELAARLAGTRRSE